MKLPLFCLPIMGQLWQTKPILNTSWIYVCWRYWASSRKLLAVKINFAARGSSYEIVKTHREAIAHLMSHMQRDTLVDLFTSSFFSF